MKNVFFYDTKIGKIAIIENDNTIIGVETSDCMDARGINVSETSIIKEAAKQLNEYFDGSRKSFDLPLDPQGTEFQKKVWNALCSIPYGETRSYKQIAEQVGNPKAARAVGMANNKNPIMIFVPCHRVIGSNGKLVGYASGLDTKEKLLSLEKAL